MSCRGVIEVWSGSGCLIISLTWTFSIWRSLGFGQIVFFGGNGHGWHDLPQLSRLKKQHHDFPCSWWSLIFEMPIFMFDTVYWLYRVYNYYLEGAWPQPTRKIKSISELAFYRVSTQHLWLSLVYPSRDRRGGGGDTDRTKRDRFLNSTMFRLFCLLPRHSLLPEWDKKGDLVRVSILNGFIRFWALVLIQFGTLVSPQSQFNQTVNNGRGNVKLSLFLFGVFEKVGYSEGRAFVNFINTESDRESLGKEFYRRRH